MQAQCIPERPSAIGKPGTDFERPSLGDFDRSAFSQRIVFGKGGIGRKRPNSNARSQRNNPVYRMENVYRELKGWIPQDVEREARRSFDNACPSTSKGPTCY